MIAQITQRIKHLHNCLGRLLKKNGCCYNSSGSGYGCPCANSALEAYGFQLTNPSDPNTEFMVNQKYESCQLACWNQAMSCFVGDFFSNCADCVPCADTNPNNYQYQFDVCSNNCFNSFFGPYHKSGNSKDWQDLPDYKSLFEVCNVNYMLPCTCNTLDSTYNCAPLPGGNFSIQPCSTTSSGECYSGGCPVGTGPEGC